MNVLLDTNVLLRSADPAYAQYQRAADAVDAVARRGDTLCLVPQNFYEFWAVSTRPLAQNGRGLTPDEVVGEFAFFDSRFTLLPDSTDVFTEWRRLVATYKVSGKPSHDARLAAAMIVHGVAHVLTFNAPDFRRYAGVTALTPADVLAGP